MAHSYSNMLFHVVWSTKNRYPFINPEMKSRLYSYIREVANDEGSTILTMNGMPDHIHLLLSIKPNMMLSDLIKNIKTTSSKFVKSNFSTEEEFNWQEGYGAFSVGISTQQSVKKYIENQEIHHKTQSFEDEYIGFLNAHKILYDKRFVID